MLQRSQHISTEAMTAIILISGLVAITYFSMSGNFSLTLVIATFPFTALLFGSSVKYPIISLLCYGIVAGFWGMIARILAPSYSNISVLLEISMIYYFICMLFHAIIVNDFNWKYAINAMTVGYALWFIFCFVEVLNPRGLIGAWINTRGFYPSTLLFAMFCSILLTRYKLVKILIIAVAIHAIIAFFKDNDAEIYRVRRL